MVNTTTSNHNDFEVAVDEHCDLSPEAAADFEADFQAAFPGLGDLEFKATCAKCFAEYGDFRDLQYHGTWGFSEEDLAEFAMMAKYAEYDDGWGEHEATKHEWRFQPTYEQEHYDACTAILYDEFLKHEAALAHKASWAFMKHEFVNSDLYKALERQRLQERRDLMIAEGKATWQLMKQAA